MRPELKLVLGAAAVAALVLVVPEALGPGPSADFAVGERLKSGALWVPLGLVFAGGLLTALTPCVYPLIPITVSIFGARQAPSRGRAVALTLAYNLGIAVMFTSLGIGAALTGKAFGRVLGNPYVVAGLAALLLVLAASMFGAFDFQLPSSIQSRLGGVGRAGFAGAFLMGLAAGVVAAPCTGPVLSGVLLHVAASQDVPVGALLLFTYALGLGLPFFLIGAFSLSLPKSGAWMETVKSVFGIALATLAVLYLRDGFPALRQALSLKAVAYGALIAAALAFAGVLAGAVHRSFHAWPAEGLLKALGVLLVVLGITLRPDAPLASPAGARLEWLADEARAVAQAGSQKRPLLIDFSAEWCGACKELDKYVFSDDRFEKEARRFVLARVDATKASPEVDAIHARYSVGGLPTVVLIDSSGKVREELTVKGYLPPQEFVALLKKVR